jgi:lipopolysaccharide/colanic/teichoic acid biosynthesis glycosyltransferase
MSLATYEAIGTAELDRASGPVPPTQIRAATSRTELRPSDGPRRQRGAGRTVRRMLWPAADVLAVAIAAVVTGAGPARGAGYGLLVLVAAAAGGLHRMSASPRATDLAGRLTIAAGLPALVLSPWLSATRAIALAGCTTVAMVALRAAAGGLLRSARRRGALTRRALIIGDGAEGRQLARLLTEHPEFGLAPCGVLDDRSPGAPGLPLLGGIRAAGSVVDRHDVAHVLVCRPATPDGDLLAAVRACQRQGAEVSILPAPPELGLAVPRSRLDEIWGIPLIPLRPGAQARGRRVAKRATDLAIGTALTVLTAPVMAVLAVAVWVDLRLPPLFRQVRVTGPGRRATITKLRTLRPAGDPDTAWQISAGQCSALGRILRGTHADELPQLGSVLRGDMSLVGPRPERPHFARKLAAAVPGYADRERVTAGLTGWAQVHGLTGDTSIADRARFDNFYIEYWSAWLDLLILVRTIPAALSGALRSARGGTQ